MVRAGKLGQSDASFATNLLRAYEKWGYLTPKQAPWVGKLVEIGQGRPRNDAQPLAANVKRIFELFATAQAHGLKYPRIRLQTASGAPLALILAGEKSRYRGCVQLTDGGK